MALRGTLTHWKTRLLASSLKMMPCQALGILESLWHVTAELAPAGNVGRLPNQAIAMEMFYEGDADELISALVKSGHLDENKEHRLIVHDWSQHADYNTKRKVERRKESIIANDGSRLVMTRHESIPEPVPVPEPVPEPEEKTNTLGETAEDLPLEAKSEQHGAVEHVFDFYLKALKKNPNMYTLTRKRMEKGLLCLRHCLKLEGGDMQKAVNRMCDAVDGLTKSKWHMGKDPRNSKLFVDWEEYVFKSVETMEKRWEDFQGRAS